MNKAMMRKLGFNDEVDNVEQKKCPCCKKEVDEFGFKDALSRKEYRLSGLCQKCQDKTFG